MQDVSDTPIKQPIAMLLLPSYCVEYEQLQLRSAIYVRGEECQLIGLQEQCGGTAGQRAAKP